jgi:1-phosphatidylinositol phosphodiesterase
MYHGDYSVQVSFQDVLSSIRTFLVAYPGEVVLARLKIDKVGGGNFQTFGQVLTSTLVPYSTMVYRPSPSETFSSLRLGRVRGKLVFLQDFDLSNGQFGVSYSGLTAQDNDNLGSIWGLSTKWDQVRVHLETAASTLVASSNAAFINYLSASGGVPPWFTASGKAGADTGAPQLSTGINQLTMNWCFSSVNTRGSVGIVVADFPGSGLISAIVSRNAHLPIACARNAVTAGAWLLLAAVAWPCFPGVSE